MSAVDWGREPKAAVGQVAVVVVMVIAVMVVGAGNVASWSARPGGRLRGRCP